MDSAVCDKQDAQHFESAPLSDPLAIPSKRNHLSARLNDSRDLIFLRPTRIGLAYLPYESSFRYRRNIP